MPRIWLFNLRTLITTSEWPWFDRCTFSVLTHLFDACLWFIWNMQSIVLDTYHTCCNQQSRYKKQRVVIVVNTKRNANFRYFLYSEKSLQTRRMNSVYTVKMLVECNTVVCILSSVESLIQLVHDIRCAKSELFVLACEKFFCNWNNNSFIIRKNVISFICDEILMTSRQQQPALQSRFFFHVFDRFLQTAKMDRVQRWWNVNFACLL